MRRNLFPSTYSYPFLISFCLSTAASFLMSCGMSNQNNNQINNPNSSGPQPIFSVVSTPSAPFSLQVGSTYTLDLGLIAGTSGVTPSYLKFRTTGANSLGSLPAGWSWTGSTSSNVDPSVFTGVSTGSGSQIFLTFSPTSTSNSGTLSLDLLSNTGDVIRTITFPYQATTDNNVVPVTSVPVQVVSTSSSGIQPVIVSFLSDSTTPITNFSVPSLSLPAGWTSTASSLSCPVVNNSCFLTLNYNPALAASSGVVTITGTGTSSSSATKQVTVSIPYSNNGTASGSNLVPIVNSGQPVVAGALGSSQVVPITFKASGSTPVTGVTLSGTLPAGWTTLSGSSTVSSSTASVLSAGANNFVVNLVYSPTGSASSGVQSFALTATGTSGSNTITTGVNVNYQSTPASSNNLIASTTSLGNVGSTTSGQQQIGVSFFTDNGTLATGVVLNATDVATLSSLGIAVSPSLNVCDGTTTSSACNVTLTYNSSLNPSLTGANTLRYTYYDQSGTSKDGTLVFNFAPATQTQMMATLSTGLPVVGTYDSLAPGANATPVTVSFTTNQGTGILENIAATLPGGWVLSSGPTLPCSVTTTPSCSATYTYQPTALTSSTSFDFNYTYSLDGTPATRVSTVFPVSYSSAPPASTTKPDFFYRYFTDETPSSGKIKKCKVASGKTPGTVPGSMVISTDCSDAVTIPLATTNYKSIHLATFSGTTFMYAFSAATQQMVRCTMYSTTNPSNPNYKNFDPATCTTSFLPAGENSLLGSFSMGIAKVANGNTYLYFRQSGISTVIRKCKLNPAGGTSNPADCVSLANISVDNPRTFDFVYNTTTNTANRMYISSWNAQSRLYSCALQSDGSVNDISTACASVGGIMLPNSPPALPDLVSAEKLYAVRIKNSGGKSYAFLSSIDVASTNSGYIYRCEIQPDGTFGSTLSTVNSKCAARQVYQAGVPVGQVGFYSTELHILSDTNYMYAATEDSAKAPTLCQLDFLGSDVVQNCTSIDPAHPYPGNPFNISSIY